jgi:hypothetical protein
MATWCSVSRLVQELVFGVQLSGGEINRHSKKDGT